MGSKTENCSWQFNLDEINLYAFKDNFLSPLECDQIIEIGNHEELISNNGKYKKLYQLQYANKT